MKDNMFELLLTLFEKSLAQLRKRGSLVSEEDAALANESMDDSQNLMIKHQNETSTRVFIYEEQMKLTKASQQFLMKMRSWQLLNERQFENIMGQLLFSDSRVVNLQETKWVIKNVLSNDLSNHQLLFLDLLLDMDHQTETVH